MTLLKFVPLLRGDGCSHTDPLEGGGLCAICSNELATKIEAMKVYVVVRDTGGAHEPEGSWSIWTTAEAALQEADRLNIANDQENWETTRERLRPRVMARGTMDRADGSGAFYVVAVNLDESRDDNIG